MSPLAGLSPRSNWRGWLVALLLFAAFVAVGTLERHWELEDAALLEAARLQVRR